MKKPYEALTDECWSELTDKKTIFVKPKIAKCGDNFFQKFPDDKSSKITLNIQDRTAGKGDNAVVVYYNLDLADFYYLVLKGSGCIMTGQKFAEFYAKIYGESVVNSGPHAEMSAAIHCSITRTPVDGQGKPMRSPWRITIENGFAKRGRGKIPGSWYEMPNTFIPEKKAFYQMTDKSITHLCVNILRAIRETSDLFANEKLAKGREAYASLKAQGTHASSGSAQQTQAQPQAATYRVLAVSNVQKDEIGYKLMMRFSDGYDRPVYFLHGIPQEIEQARRAGYETSVNCYIQDNRLFAC